jgi:hypothetical protein
MPSYISGIMYSVVAHNADPYLELDAPALFSNHHDALKYASEVAMVFRAAEGRPATFSISGPDGSRVVRRCTLLGRGSLLFRAALGSERR